MKVVLINAPRINGIAANYPPLGLACVGAVAQQAGHTVCILDAAGWDWDTLRSRVRAEAPEVVGVTCWTIERGQAFLAALVAREAAPNARIVMGGPHASAFPLHMFIRANADYVVIGEGEETFRELLSALESGADLSRVQSLAYREGGEIRLTPRRPFIRDLDALPMPLHDQFDYASYKGIFDSTRRAAAVVTSRGCPFRCIFCSSTAYWGHTYRRRSVENVMEEVEFLYHRHGVRAIQFYDDNLVIDRERCIALSQALIERKLDLIWVAEGSVRVDEDLLGWMKRAGCYRIDFGVESGSPEILRNIRKAFTVDDTRRAFQLCAKAGIKPNAYLVVGAPGETRRTVRETVRLMREIQPDVSTHVSGLWILPETPIYEMALKSGIIKEQDWLLRDETFFYTAEHSREAITGLSWQFERAMAWSRGPRAYVKVLLHQAGHSRVVRWAVGALLGWRRRLARLVHDPAGFWQALRRRLSVRDK